MGQTTAHRQTLATLTPADCLREYNDPSKVRTLTVSESTEFNHWLGSRFARIAGFVRVTPDPVEPAEIEHYWHKLGTILVSSNDNGSVWGSVTNTLFRAVHDADHLFNGLGFDLAGEIAAYKVARDCAPPAIDWILFSEIVLQAGSYFAAEQWQPQRLVYSSLHTLA